MRIWESINFMIYANFFSMNLCLWIFSTTISKVYEFVNKKKIFLPSAAIWRKKNQLHICRYASFCCNWYEKKKAYVHEIKIRYRSKVLMLSCRFISNRKSKICDLRIFYANTTLVLFLIWCCDTSQHFLTFIGKIRGNQPELKFTRYCISKSRYATYLPD